MGECPKAVKSLSTYVNFREKVDKYKLWVHLLLQVALFFWLIMNVNFKERYHNSQYMQLEGVAILVSSCYFHEIAIFCFTNYQAPKEIEDCKTSNQTSQQRTRKQNRYMKASQNLNITHIVHLLHLYGSLRLIFSTLILLHFQQKAQWIGAAPGISCFWKNNYLKNRLQT